MISAVANRLFYRGILCDGVSVQDRMPLMVGKEKSEYIVLGSTEIGLSVQ